MSYGAHCQECGERVIFGHEWWLEGLDGDMTFCSKVCADFFLATQEADDLAYVMQSLGMEVSDA